MSIISKLRSKKVLILALTIVLVAGGLTLYFLEARNNEVDNYTYPYMETYSMPGKVATAGLNFTKPVDFVKLTEASGQVEFQQPIFNSDHNKSVVAYFSAASTTEASAYTQAQLDALKANLAYPNDNYNSVISPVNQFIKDRLPSDWQIKLDQAKPFTNSYIKDNAWQFTISTKDPNKKSGVYKGKAIYTVYGNNFYYFMLTTTSDNWQSNGNTWQQIFDSLQINR